MIIKVYSSPIKNKRFRAEVQTKDGIKKIDFGRNDVVLDIGANIGCVSIYLAKKYPKIKIYAFEAHPVNFQSLLYNIKLNSVYNIIPVNKAVYSETGKILTISLDTTNTGASSCFIQRDTKEFSVETISLDDIIKGYDITELKLLKIDCEGAEFDIIEGSNLIQDLEINTLGMEVHGFMREHGKDFDKFYSLLDGLNVKNKNIKQLG